MIKISEPYINLSDVEQVVLAMARKEITNGSNVLKFERKLAECTRAEYAISTSTGTAAMHLALLANGVRKNGDVILPTMTFVGTLWGILYIGAKPIFIDSEPSSWNIDPNLIEDKITENTQAIIGVDLWGSPCDRDPIIDIANKYNIPVIWDSAESLGSSYNGAKIGEYGDTILSFYGNKIVTTGEGGAILTNSRSIYEYAVHARNHCMKEQYFHDAIGYNYRMDNLRASLGISQIGKLDRLIAKKLSISRLYDKLIAELEMPVYSQKEIHKSKSNNWLKAVIVDGQIPIPRLRKSLYESDIETRPFFTPLHSLPFLREYGEFPVALRSFNRGLVLPNHFYLKDEDIEYIVQSLGGLINAG